MSTNDQASSSGSGKMSGKIVLAVEYASHNPNARELALALANQLQIELVGLFFEGEDLLLSAQYPFSREIVSGADDDRSTDMENMQRSLRAWSTHKQQQLMEQARKKNIKCSFQHLSDRQSAALLTQSDDDTLLVFSGFRVIHYPLQRQAHTVCLLVDDNSRLQQSLSILDQVIPQGINHVVFIDTGGATSQDLIQETISKSNFANTHYQVRKLSTQKHFEASLAETLKAVTRHHATAFIMVPGGHRLLSMPEFFKSLQRNLSCPLVIAG